MFLPLGIRWADGERMELVQKEAQASLADSRGGQNCGLAFSLGGVGHSRQRSAWPFTTSQRVWLAKQFSTRCHNEGKQLRRNSKEYLYIELPGGPWQCDKLALKRLKSLRRVLETKSA